MKKWIGWMMAAALPWSAHFLAAEELPVEADVSSATLAVVPAETPFQWPVSRSIAGHKIKIVSVFGQRPAGPEKKIEMHTGIDFNVPPEASVKAAKGGKILFVGFSKTYTSRTDKKDPSRLVIVQHADGTSTRYVHLNSAKVRPGQMVKAGELLGKSGASDEQAQPVLHFEIRDASGLPLNPQPLLEAAPIP